MNDSPASYRSLSEDAIKRAFVPFLKDFYKNRYAFQHESFEARTDNIGAGGIVADGLIRFRRDDGTPFLCTYEATPLDKAEEVRFTLNTRYLMWDGLAFGAMVSAITYAALYTYQFEWLHSLKTAGNIGILTGIGMIAFFCWQLFMQKWRKYRYIYAVEQFKRYFANEQWVALGEDVFPAPTDPYLEELKHQCMANGFGLALVHKTGLVRIVMAPSRLGIFGKDRKMVEFFTQNPILQTMANNLRVVTQGGAGMASATRRTANAVFRPVSRWVLKPVGGFFFPQADSVNRFMTAQGVQKWVFALSLLLALPLIYHVIRYEEQAFTDTEQYLPQRYDENPEDEPYLLEKEQPSEVIYFRRDEPSATEVPQSDEAITTIDLSGDGIEDEEPPPTTTKPTQKPASESTKLADKPASEKPKPKPQPQAAPAVAKPKPPSVTPVKPVDPCAEWDNIKGWIIQDNSFSSRETADLRVKALKQRGLKAEVVLKKCFTPGASGYLVRLDEIFAKETEARIRAAEILEALERYNLAQGNPLVKSINL